MPSRISATFHGISLYSAVLIPGHYATLFVAKCFLWRRIRCRIGYLVGENLTLTTGLSKPHHWGNTNQ